MTAVTDLSSRAVHVRPSLIRELANGVMGKKGLIPLWFGESSVPTPEFIRVAAAESIAAGETFYTEGLGIPELRRAIAEYTADLYSVEMAPDRVAVTVSGSNGLNLAFQAILEEGDTVATHTPAYPNLLMIPELQGARLVGVPLELVDGTWKLDLDVFLRQAAGAKAVLINSPANPTGFMLTQDEMRALLDGLRDRGTWLISDEVYARSRYGANAAPSFLEVAEPEDRLIVVSSFSKAWAMTGWRLGWLTAPRSVIPTIERIMEFSVSCAPAFAQRAGIAALEGGEPFIQETNRALRSARDLVASTLDAHPTVLCPVPEATFYLFFRVADVADSVRFARALVDQANVGIAPGDAFFTDEPGWFRLCYARSEAELAEAMARVEPWLADPSRL